jgi:hypothetical protein
MSATIHYMAQYTPEWWQKRRGYPSASDFDRVLTPGGKPSGQQTKYICELIGDLLDQRPNFFSDKKPMTRAMQDGRDNEPDARRFYEFHKTATVQQVGGVVSDCGRFWCSPDGLVGEDGVIELKCPKLSTQSEYLLEVGEDEIPTDYLPQVHGHLIVTGRPWVDFLSFAYPADPFLRRAVPNDYTAKLRAELDRFHEKYEAARRKLGVIRKPGDAE